MSPNTIPFRNPQDGSAKRLNVGCGRHYHSDWVNLDLQSDDPSVICHDVTQGIPFTDDHFEMVYHSHILEHLSPQQGRELIAECYRVLKPGGILRIVVPNLEEIAQLYLSMHDQAWQGDQLASVNYHWMKMELLDQMVRSQSGGLMGPYMVSISDENAEFVKSRIGSEFHLCRAPDCEPKTPPKRESIVTRVGKILKHAKLRTAKGIVRFLLGEKAKLAFEESIFRGEGEIHRWMYDRYSLRELCTQAGFTDFRIQTAFESQIEGYVDYELDSVDQQIRKPDSLFVECTKPAMSMRATG